MSATGGGTTPPAVILVIDDNPQIVDLLCTFLEIAHLEPLAATSPEEALALWGRHSKEITVLVTDLNLPGTNGDVLAAVFLKEKPDLAVLYTSGTPWVANVRLEQGRNFFHKPFSFNEVTTKILEITGSPSRQTDPAQDQPWSYKFDGSKCSDSGDLIASMAVGFPDPASETMTQ